MESNAVHREPWNKGTYYPAAAQESLEGRQCEYAVFGCSRAAGNLGPGDGGQPQMTAVAVSALVQL